jgi:cytochrome c553
MKRMQAIAISLAALGLAAGSAFAADAAAGKAKAASCAGCHGANGEGKGAAGPAIAGMDKAKFEQMLKDYKSGKRANPVMKSISANLSDADCDNLAEYYASLKK